MAKVIDLSTPVLPPVVDGFPLKGPQFKAPPAEIFPQVMGEISKAVDSIGDAQGGFIFLHDKAQTGQHKSNAVFVQKLNEKGTWAVMAWVAKDWNHSGLGYGAAVSATWGKG